MEKEDRSTKIEAQIRAQIVGKTPAQALQSAGELDGSPAAMVAELFVIYFDDMAGSVVITDELYKMARQAITERLASEASNILEYVGRGDGRAWFNSSKDR